MYKLFNQKKQGICRLGGGAILPGALHCESSIYIICGVKERGGGPRRLSALQRFYPGTRARGHRKCRRSAVFVEIAADYLTDLKDFVFSF